MVPISNRPFQGLPEYLKEMLTEVLQIVVLCRGQVSWRTTDVRAISCWCVYQCPLCCRSSESVSFHGPLLMIDTDSFAVLAMFILWWHGGWLSNLSEFHHGYCTATVVTLVPESLRFKSSLNASVVLRRRNFLKFYNSKMKPDILSLQWTSAICLLIRYNCKMLWAIRLTIIFV